MGVLGEVAELDVVAAAQATGLERAVPGQRLDQRRLADPVRADQRDVLAALEPELAVLEQRATGHLEAGVVELEHHPPGALGGAEAEAERAGVGRVALDPLDLLQALHARLRLARLGGLVAEALDEALHALDLALLLLDRLAERDLASGELAPPRVPRAGEEARAARLQLQHRGADRLQEPAVVGDQDDRGVEAREVALEPLERRDVEVVGGLVEQQQVGVAGERPGERGARELAAGEGAQLAVELLVREAQAVQRGERLRAPVPAARVLEAGLGDGIAPKQVRIARVLRHRALDRSQPLLERDQVGAAGEHVVAQRQTRLPRRPLVVERDASALLEDELAAVDRVLRGQHAQQGGLPGPVAARERHPIAPLELERHAPEQRSPRHVLVQRRCDHNRHALNRHTSRTQVTHALAPSACGPTFPATVTANSAHTRGTARSGSWRGASMGWLRWRSCSSWA